MERQSSMTPDEIFEALDKLAKTASNDPLPGLDMHQEILVDTLAEQLVDVQVRDFAKKRLAKNSEPKDEDSFFEAVSEFHKNLAEEVDDYRWTTIDAFDHAPVGYSATDDFIQEVFVCVAIMHPNEALQITFDPERVWSAPTSNPAG